MRLKRFSSLVGAVVVALFGFMTLSCGGPKNKIVPVAGKLLFTDGKPLPTGTRLLLTPGEGDRGTASGLTSADGSFHVTHVSGATGAEVGKYAILLAAPEANREGFFQTVPKDYYDGGVFFTEVKDGMPPLDLKVKKKQLR